MSVIIKKIRNLLGQICFGAVLTTEKLKKGRVISALSALPTIVLSVHLDLKDTIEYRDWA